MGKFKMVPVVYAGDLSPDIENELMEWDDEIALHYSTGVYSLERDDVEKLPLFVAWMIEIGAWTAENVDLPSYEKYCKDHNLTSSGEPHHYKEFYSWLDGRKTSVDFGLTGT